MQTNSLTLGFLANYISHSDYLIYTDILCYMGGYRYGGIYIWEIYNLED